MLDLVPSTYNIIPLLRLIRLALLSSTRAAHVVLSSPWLLDVVRTIAQSCWCKVVRPVYKGSICCLVKIAGNVVKPFRHLWTLVCELPVCTSDSVYVSASRSRRSQTQTIVNVIVDRVIMRPADDR